MNNSCNQLKVAKNQIRGYQVNTYEQNCKNAKQSTNTYFLHKTQSVDLVSETKYTRKESQRFLLI